MTRQHRCVFTFSLEYSPDTVHLQSKHKYLSSLCVRLQFHCDLSHLASKYSWQLHVQDAASRSLASSPLRMAQQQKIGQKYVNVYQTTSRTATRQVRDRIITSRNESRLGCPKACQSERIYCSETGITIAARGGGAQHLQRRRRGGGKRERASQTAGQTTVHKVADKTQQLNQPVTSKIL